MNDMGYSLGWHDTRLKPSGKHEARWAESVNGQVVARGKSFLTKAAAQKFAVDMATNILHASLGLAVLRKDLLDAIDEFYKQYTDEGTLLLYTRHLNDFLAWKKLVYVGELTDTLVREYDAHMLTHGGKTKTGRTPGGRRCVLKTLQAFTNFCIEKEWLRKDPFANFTLPTSDYEGRALTPDEYAKMTRINPLYAETEKWISLAIRLGNGTMLRISQIWKLTPEDFREPDLLHVQGIKMQDTEWKPLHPGALAALREALVDCEPRTRIFKWWGTLDGMRQSIRKKADREGLQGVRFHDAGKVTRISELSENGCDLARLAHISNTSRRTLVDHYIKADKKQAQKWYQTYTRPFSDQNGAKQAGQAVTERNSHNVENAPEISAKTISDGEVNRSAD